MKPEDLDAQSLHFIRLRTGLFNLQAKHISYLSVESPTLTTTEMTTWIPDLGKWAVYNVSVKATVK